MRSNKSLDEQIVSLKIIISRTATYQKPKWSMDKGSQTDNEQTWRRNNNLEAMRLVLIKIKYYLNCTSE